LPEGLSEFRHKVHATIKKVTEDIEDSFHFNTAIAAVMELVNAFYLAVENLPKDETTLRVYREAVEAILLLVSPMVPHVAEELWQALRQTSLLLEVPWPQPQAEALTVSSLTVVIQVNGKVRSRLQVPATATDADIKNLALADPVVAKWLQGQSPKKIILARRKLVNIVV
jgi:leucyl-tRNA synthetase